METRRRGETSLAEPSEVAPTGTLLTVNSGEDGAYTHSRKSTDRLVMNFRDQESHHSSARVNDVGV